MDATLNDFSHEELTPAPVALDACANCGSTSATGTYLSDVLLSDGKELRLCDDCAHAEAQREFEAEVLAALPSCTERSMIIDAAQTTGELVNRLRAHDLGNCADCRAPQQGERDRRMAGVQATQKQEAA